MLFLIIIIIITITLFDCQSNIWSSIKKIDISSYKDWHIIILVNNSTSTNYLQDVRSPYTEHAASGLPNSQQHETYLYLLAMLLILQLYSVSSMKFCLYLLSIEVYSAMLQTLSTHSTSSMTFETYIFILIQTLFQSCCQAINFTNSFCY